MKNLTEGNEGNEGVVIPSRADGEGPRKRPLGLVVLLLLFTVHCSLITSSPAQVTTLAIDKNGNLLGSTGPDINFKGRLKFAPAVDQIDWVLAPGNLVPSTQAAIYSSINHAGAGTYARSATSWVRNSNIGANSSPIDLTCIAVYNSTNNFHGVTAITPRHVIMATVNPPADGATVRFVTNSNVSVSRTISSHTDITTNSQQFRIAKLDSDLPGTITPAKVMPVLDFAKQIGRGVVVVDHLNQKLFTIDIVPSANNYLGEGTASQSSARAAFYGPVGWPANTNQGGGNFIIVDNQLIFLGPLYEDQNIWSSVASVHAAINAALTSLGGGYQLADYTKDLPPVPPAQRPTQAADGAKIYDGSHALMFDATNRVLKLADGTVAINLNNPASDGSLWLGGSYVLMSNLMTGNIFDGDNIQAQDITYRKLTANDGTTVALDWSDPTKVTFGLPAVPPHLADGSAPNDSIYYSTTSGKLVYKDSGGTVHALY